MSPAAPTLQPPANGVTVRMYRQQLGDCFLLAFPTGQPDQAYYVLIDCGLLQGAPNASATLTRIAQDVAAATGSRLDLLVVTHRHYDHISGFKLADDVFATITVNNLWLAWAENPHDQFALTLWGKTNQVLTGLAGALNRPGAAAALAPVRNILDFVGDLGLAAAGGDPLQPVRQLLKAPKQPAYLEPGSGPMTLPLSDGTPHPLGVRVYVLAPPRNTTLLSTMDPNQPNETYLTGTGLTQAAAFAVAATPPGGLPDEDPDLREQAYPFEPSVRITQDEAQDTPFFRAHYGFDDQPAPRPADTPRTPGDVLRCGIETTKTTDHAGLHGPAWRRIDEDWLSSSAELALQLDNCINNTSLALAIELPQTHKILMFVGDAQVGNWVSWDGMTWSLPEGGTVSGSDLLARTALYKVGHHGSENATVQSHDGHKWGLELMTRSDLVAMLPVHEDFACSAKGWEMPAANLYQRLETLTQGRVLRGDFGVPQNPPSSVNVDPAQWQIFLKQTAASPDDLWVQYTVTD